jgi:hypothetical protein
MDSAGLGKRQEEKRKKTRKTRKKRRGNTEGTEEEDTENTEEEKNTEGTEEERDWTVFGRAGALTEDRGRARGPSMRRGDSMDCARAWWPCRKGVIQ